MKKLILPLFIISILFISCKKEINNEVNQATPYTVQLTINRTSSMVVRLCFIATMNASQVFSGFKPRDPL